MFIEHSVNHDSRFVIYPGVVIGGSIHNPGKDALLDGIFNFLKVGYCPARWIRPKLGGMKTKY